MRQRIPTYTHENSQYCRHDDDDGDNDDKENKNLMNVNNNKTKQKLFTLSAIRRVVFVRLSV